MNSTLSMPTVESDSNVMLTVLGDQPYPSFEINSIIRYLDHHHPGHSRQLLEACNLSAAEIREAFIPAFKMLSVFEYCATHFEPTMALRLGQTYSIDDLGVFGYAFASSNSLADAVEFADKYNALTGNLLEKSYHIQGAYYMSRFHNVQNLPPEILNFFVVLSLTANIHISRQVFGEKLNYGKINLTFDDRENRQLYEDIFGCSVTFDSEYLGWGIELNMLSMSKLNEEHLTSNAAVYIPYCNELMESMKQKDSLVNEIQHILISCSGDYPDIEMLSGAFNISSRTLRRQLSALGTSYQKILNKVRCQLAIEYLTKTDITIEDISNLLGFSDVTNFRHAFKKWVNKTPSYYRKIDGQQC